VASQPKAAAASIGVAGRRLIGCSTMWWMVASEIRAISWSAASRFLRLAASRGVSSGRDGRRSGVGWRPPAPFGTRPLSASHRKAAAAGGAAAAASDGAPGPAALGSTVQSPAKLKASQSSKGGPPPQQAASSAPPAAGATGRASGGDAVRREGGWPGDGGGVGE